MMSFDAVLGARKEEERKEIDLYLDFFRSI